MRHAVFGEQPGVARLNFAALIDLGEVQHRAIEPQTGSGEDMALSPLGGHRCRRDVGPCLGSVDLDVARDGRSVGPQIGEHLPQRRLCEQGAVQRAETLAQIVEANPERLALARSFDCETVDLREDAELADMIAEITGEPVVDAAVDAVGFEARGHGKVAGEAPATVLNDVMTAARTGASLGIPGLYVTGDPGGIDENAKIGQLGVRIGLGWAKSHTFTTGQCPVKRYTGS